MDYVVRCQLQSGDIETLDPFANVEHMENRTDGYVATLVKATEERAWGGMSSVLGREWQAHGFLLLEELARGLTVGKRSVDSIHLMMAVLELPPAGHDGKFSILFPGVEEFADVEGLHIQGEAPVIDHRERELEWCQNTLGSKYDN
jgi:hypothetical protein